MSLFFHRSSSTNTKSKNAMRNGGCMDRQHQNNNYSNNHISSPSPVHVDTNANPEQQQQQHNIRPRIPITLQNVFLQSNRGEEVHVPPPKNMASRIFRTLTFRHHRSSHQSDKNHHGRYYGRNKSSVTTTTTTLLDHTTTNSSSNSSSSCDDDATVIVEVNASYSSSTGTSTSISSNDNLIKNNNNNNSTTSLPMNTSPPNTKQYNDIVVVVHPTNMKKELTLMVTPLSYVDAILQSRGYPTTKYNALETSYYNIPTAYQQICYDTYILKLVKQTEMIDTPPKKTNTTNSIHALKQLFLAGISSNPCNAHGESLLHTICRLGTGNNNNNTPTLTTTTTTTNSNLGSTTPSRSYELLQLMISYGKCDVTNCVDDYGRTPLHDACWCHAICYDTIALLLQHDPTLIVLQDCRGATPLSYIPVQHHTKFMEFISQYKDQFFPDIRHKSGSSSSTPFPSPLVQEPPNGRPVPDPTNALSPDVARMVVSGRITPQELSILLLQDDDEEDDDDDDDDDDESESSYEDDEDDDEVDDSSTILSTEGDLLLSPQKINTRTTTRHVSTTLNDDELEEDDDVDDEESYSDLEEMLRQLKSPSRSATAESQLQSDDEPVLGICRPQYGYEMMNTNNTPSETNESRNSNHLKLNVDRGNCHNDRYHENSNMNEDVKPMLSVVIPTIHCNNIDGRRSSEATTPALLSHCTNSRSPTKKSSENPTVTDMTNELLEFSV